ncbi:DNA cytosine methyltransferase [Desulfoluna spongiiphila]|uniref:DNA cytosine methyltransferase n=1 Tax=Desulfoluna spongiiphila TaxID=419481 RepID=UPI0012578C40|nr:DNA cytosine methyltransferase [Desulfoluna spongiiphila]VVS95341.1 c-5 cytosine methyltransferase [Desulfoluna spongiiphila]
MKRQQYDLNFRNELIVDNFAGGGGASIGIEMGANRFVDIAINHDEKALEVHELNHPHADHYPEDVFKVDPVKVCKGQPVGIAWFSPDCRHFSKAKGKKPVSRKVRGLAWVARRWARDVAPRIIFLENVEEFKTWGPCVEKWDPKKEEWVSSPDPKRKGLTFEAFKRWFERNGYVVEHRVLKACDYGAPTIRKRFFMIARNDGLPIVWPEPTHGPRTSPLVKKRKLKPHRSAAECIDWSIPCPSIFMTEKEAKAFKDATGITVRRPLKDNSLKRLAKGTVKYVIESGDPYIVPISNYGTGGVRVHSINEPLRTITAFPKGGAFALCTPFVSPYYGTKGGRDVRGQPLAEPLATQTTENRHALVTPFISKINHTSNENKGFRGQGINEALHTVTGRNGFSLCTPFIARQFGESVGSSIESPLGTITAGGQGKSTLVAPLIARQFGTGVCHPLVQPLNTITAQGGGGKNQLVASFLAKHYTGATGSSLTSPMATVTSVDHHALVNLSLSQEEVEEGALRVAAFLIKYYGQGIGQTLHEPMHTLTTKERLSLVTVTFREEPYLIYDLGMRMLWPHELMLAQGFPVDYKLGGISKTKAVQLIGNSVPPPFSEALTRANYTEMVVWRATA